MNQPLPKTSTRTLISLFCGIFSMMGCGFFAGIPAIVLGNYEISDINEGKTDPSNLVIAQTGVILGSIGTVISIFMTLGLAFLITMIASPA